MVRFILSDHSHQRLNAFVKRNTVFRMDRYTTSDFSPPLETYGRDREENDGKAVATTAVQTHNDYDDYMCCLDFDRLEVERTGISPGDSTAVLSSIFDNLEELCKNIEAENSKLEEFRKILASGKVPASDSGIGLPTDLGKEEPSTSSANQSDCFPKKRFRRRKLAKPVRSAVRYDPNFRGVTVHMETKVCGCDSKLIIMSSFSKKAPRPMQPRCRRNSAGHADSPSCSDSDDNSHGVVKQPMLYVTEKIPWRYSVLGGKACASCATRKTPLWRDAEDGTPLCNACGIRYKKYRVRCSRCWHIPKKDGKSYPHCPCCGALLSISSCKRAW